MGANVAARVDKELLADVRNGDCDDNPVIITIKSKYEKINNKYFHER